MSDKETRNLVTGAIATVIAAITGAAFVLGIIVGAGFGLLVMTAGFTVLSAFIAYIELGGDV